MDDIRRELRIRAATKQVQSDYHENLEEDQRTLKKLMSDKYINKHKSRFHFSPIPLCPRAYRELPADEI
jgi:hypothetical protein